MARQLAVMEQALCYSIYFVFSVILSTIPLETCKEALPVKQGKLHSKFIRNSLTTYTHNYYAHYIA